MTKESPKDVVVEAVDVVVDGNLKEWIFVDVDQYIDMSMKHHTQSRLTILTVKVGRGGLDALVCKVERD